MVGGGDVRAIEGTDVNGRRYSYRSADLIHDGTNSQIFEVLERGDLVAKFPRKPSVFQRERDAYARLATQPSLSVALTIQRGAGVDHLLLAKRPHLAYRQRLRDDQVLLVGVSLVEAVEFLVRLNIVHADLTPANVLLDAEKVTPYIVDFGNAILSMSPTVLPKRDDDTLWPVPEEFRHKPHDDVWSMLWILLALRDPRRRPSESGAIPSPADAVDTPLIEMLHELGGLRNRKDLVAGLKRLGFSLRAQIRDLGLAAAEAVYVPSPAAKARIAQALVNRRRELVKALEALNVPDYAQTVAQDTEQLSETDGVSPPQPAPTAFRRWLREFLGH